MDSSRSGLSPLQERLVDAFCSRTDAFFLTGGSALAGYYLHHRTSQDLDFFCATDEVFPHGKRILEDAVRSLGGSLEVLREYPGFVECRATVNGQHLKVDLVRDTAPQISAAKPRFGIAIVDTLEDIAANKICAVVGRSEIRDYVDLFFLSRAGIDLHEAIARAHEKDGGVDAATFAWILGQVKVHEIPATLLQPLTSAELQAFVDDLATELARRSYPAR